MSATIGKEIRFAVVMYGGVSLAIYMNGIAQELLTLVRATLPRDPDRGGTAAVYADIAAWLGERDGLPVRFVVDVLSGTSAGGINAVCLGKALARGCRDLGSLEQIWLEEGDIGRLLNDDRFEGGRYPTAEPRRSLLNSRRMFALLADAFARMESEGAGTPLVDTLDLHVTATDLRGVEAPIRLDDGRVSERIHKHVFHFALRPDGRNDFGPGDGPMLAFASRCTSAFPAAFEPMTLQAARTQVPPAQAALVGEGLHRWQERHFAPFDPQTLDARQFADGGYLDNRPFGHAIATVRTRHATCPVERRLLFIDPFPEVHQAQAQPAAVDWVENIGLAAMALPRYETIRGDIDEIKRHNARVYRIDYLTRQIDGLVDAWSTQRAHPGERALASYRDAGLADALAVFGDGYAAYHYAKVYAVSDEITTYVVRAAGLDERSDLVFAVRRLVKAWRDALFRADPTPQERAAGVESENAFLVRYDIRYRIHRLDYLRRQIEAALAPPATRDTRPLLLQGLEPPELAEDERVRLAAIHGEIARLLDGLHALRGSLCDAGAGSPLRAAVLGLWRDFPGGLTAALTPIVEEPDRARTDALGRALFETHRTAFTAVGLAVADLIREGVTVGGWRIPGTIAVDKAFTALPDPARRAEARLLDLYRYGYDLRESMRYPLLEGEDEGEGSPVAVFRVSPVDATRLWDPAKPRDGSKLAGVALGAFGGFLDHTWRRNDILWGRLDGAERIICALLPGNDASARAARETFIDRAHRAILGEYLGPWEAELRRERAGTDQAARGLEDNLRAILAALDTPGWKTLFQDTYQVPRALDRRTLLGHAGRSTGILSSMLEGLGRTRRGSEGILGQVAPVLTGLGRALLAVADVSLPQGFPALILRQWIRVLGVLAVVMVLLGLVVDGLLGPGLLLLAVVVAARLLHDALVRFMERRGAPRWLRLLAGGAGVAAVALVGATVALNGEGYALGFAQLGQAFRDALAGLLP